MVCASDVRCDSIGISTSPPAFPSSRSGSRARASQRHRDDADISFWRQNSTAFWPLLSYRLINRFRSRAVNRRRDGRCVVFEWIWESIVVMVQVPRVITCAAIYQQSGNPPIQYPVSRLPMLLQDLPAKIFHHLLRSISWTEVDAALPIKNRGPPPPG